MDDLTYLFKMASMNEAVISTEDKPIVGTQALATCFGLLLYDENNKTALVAHLSTDWQSTLMKLLALIDYEKENNFQYLIVPGFYSRENDPYGIKRRLNAFFREFKTKNANFEPFDITKIPDNFVNYDDKTTSGEFAFDSQTGEFVTDKVKFGLNYLEAMKSR